MKKKIGAFGAGQFSLGTLVGGRPGTTIFQNPGWGGAGGCRIQGPGPAAPPGTEPPRSYLMPMNLLPRGEGPTTTPSAMSPVDHLYFLSKNVHNRALKLAQHCTKRTKNTFCTVKLTVQKMTVSPGSGAWTRVALGQKGGGGGVHGEQTECMHSPAPSLGKTN